MPQVNQKEDGINPKSEFVNINLRAIKPELRDKLKKLAKREGVTLDCFCAQVLSDKVKNSELEANPKEVKYRIDNHLRTTTAEVVVKHAEAIVAQSSSSEDPENKLCDCGHPHKGKHIMGTFHRYACSDPFCLCRTFRKKEQ